MKRVWWIYLLIGGFVSLAAAQNEGEPPAQAPTDESKPAVRPRDVDQSLPRGAEAGRMRMRWAFQRLIEELNLTEEQKAKFEEITARHEDEMVDLENRWQEIREAQRAGDRERAEKLRAEIRDQRGPESGMEEILTELEPYLDEDQVARLWGMQDQIQQRRLDREKFEWAMTQLPDQLGLDNVQKVRYQKMLESQRNKMSTGMTELRPLIEQIREARAAGNNEKARELQKLLEESVPKREDIIEGFLDELPEILNEDQIALLQKLRNEFDGVTPAGEEKPAIQLDVRKVLRAAKRIRVGEEQREQLRTIEHETIIEYRKIANKDTEAQSRLAEELKAKISTVFDDKQNGDFEVLLQRLEVRGREVKKP